MRAFVAAVAIAMVLGRCLPLAQGVGAPAPAASYGFAPTWGPNCYGPYSVNPYYGPSIGNCGRPGGFTLGTNPIAADRVIYR
jgi:hypothetical protein